jgi:hypothetical protein
MVIIGKDECLYKNHNFTFWAYEKYGLKFKILSKVGAF